MTIEDVTPKRLELRKRGKLPSKRDKFLWIYLLKGDKYQKWAEVDFVLSTEGEKDRQLIQVCWDITAPETRKREVAGLLEAMKELGLKKGKIVTWLDEDLSDERIEILPAWKWLLS